MLEEQSTTALRHGAGSGLLEGMVQGVLPEVARRVARRRIAAISTELADRICAAALAAAPQALDAMIAELEASGITNAEICDLVIPTVARRFGERWLDDTDSFVAVTIGVSRLQTLLRDREEQLRQAPSATGRRILVLVPHGCQHTLGAHAVAGQLRRDGHRVRLSLCEPTAGLARSLAGFKADIVMVSAAASSMLPCAAEAISFLRKGLAVDAPILIGGPILASHSDVAERTGADLATDSIAEALAVTV